MKSSVMDFSHFPFDELSNIGSKQIFNPKTLEHNLTIEKAKVKGRRSGS